ncbi:MAG: ABC transporter ATP-binding protein [Lachnospiraceae bacterium]|jgi:putative ABC transport system ATP-binding protein|nr:ABC transporter ATP-binding protein [Lachnospiraceae bacterium]
MEIVKCEKLSKIYGSGQTLVTALDQVELSVRQGEFVAINGSSGSGKSTLLHMLGGVDRPSGGKVWIEGTDLAGLNEKQSSIFRRRKVGIVYQFYNLIPSINIRQNILLPMLLDGRRPDEKRFDELVETLGLKDRLTHLPSQISGGQQQRAAIARALIYRPAILLADEPTGNLDRRNSDEILGLLKLSNKKYRQTILLITHDERVAVEADRVITIEDGKIIADERIRPNEENCKEGNCGEVGR